jgi:type VI protein secretion system component VasF
MPFQNRPQEAHSEAAEPLYRDSSDNAEKPTQHDLDAQAQALHASIRRLRRWLIAVSVLLGLVCAYTLFSFRHVVRDNKTAKHLAFAPESKSSTNR